jgi:hypothetical protein
MARMSLLVVVEAKVTLLAVVRVVATVVPAKVNVSRESPIETVSASVLVASERVSQVAVLQTVMLALPPPKSVVNDVRIVASASGTV